MQRMGIHAERLAVVGAAAEARREELGRVPVAGRRIRAEALEELPRERIHRRFRAVLPDLPHGIGVERLRALLGEARTRERPGVAPVDAQVVDEREVVEAAVERRGPLDRDADEARELVLHVHDAVAEPDDLGAGVAAHRRDVRRHRIAVVEEEGVRCESHDVLRDRDHHRDRAQAARTPPGMTESPTGWKIPSSAAISPVEQPRGPASHADRHDHEVGAGQRSQRSVDARTETRSAASRASTMRLASRSATRRASGFDVAEPEIPGAEIGRRDEVGQEPAGEDRAAGADQHQRARGRGRGQASTTLTPAAELLKLPGRRIGGHERVDAARLGEADRARLRELRTVREHDEAVGRGDHDVVGAASWSGRR